MMRINLLPPEILEKRRAESRIVYLGVVAAVVLVVLAVVWVFAYQRVGIAQSDLDAKQQQVQMTQAKADTLAIFEQKEQDLQARQAIAQQALAGRQNWAKLLDEISLVLPTDVWLSTMTFDQTAGLNIGGYAIDDTTDSPDVGQKTIAKTLVRLADLDGVYNVWLADSLKTDFEGNKAIQFSLTAGLQPEASQAASETPTAAAGSAAAASSTVATQ